MKNYLWIAVLALVVLVLGYLVFGKDKKVETTPNLIDETISDVIGSTSNDEPKVLEEEELDIYTAELVDITEGVDISGFNTGGNASGAAQAFLRDEKYVLHVTFTNLPELTDDYFYEGWVVKRGVTPSVVSTGAVTFEEDGFYTNDFTSDTDLTDHTVYILTLEPNDGDPAPAEHVLEGTLELN